MASWMIYSGYLRLSDVDGVNSLKRNLSLPGTHPRVPTSEERNFSQKQLVSILLHSIMVSFEKNPSASQDQSLAYVFCDAFGIAQ
jgi:hypothetical protein